MNPLAASVGVFACVCGGVLLGLFLRGALPQHHLDADSMDTVRASMGLITTMTAVLLGLLVASAKRSYDEIHSMIVEMASKVVFLDRVLANYGPEARDVREPLRRLVADTIDRLWPADKAQPARIDRMVAGGEGLFVRAEALSPQNDAQRALKAQATEVIVDLGKLRWLLNARSKPSLAVPFLVVVWFWLTMIFASFGLFAPRNATVIVTLFLCAFSVAGAFFVTLELNRPFDGLIQVPSAPMRDALGHFGQ